MYKDIVTCNDCEYFFINGDGVSMCNNERGLPFPKINDYCSNGKMSDKARVIDNSELLKLVYEQRKNG